jgi:hypothetical protein
MRRSGIIALQAALVGCTVVELTVAASAGDTPSNPYIPLFSSIISPVLSGLLGFAGSLIGANFALTNFKRQRAFDKQLDWYERAAKAVYSLAEAIDIACTFQAQPNTSVEVRKKSWTYVQRAHLQIGRIAQESRFFGSTEAIARMDEIDRFVQKVADKSEAFDPPKVEKSKRDEIVEDIFRLSDRLNKACSPLIAEGVLHLGLDSGRSRRKQSTDRTVPARRNKSSGLRAAQVETESGQG